MMQEGANGGACAVAEQRTGNLPKSYGFRAERHDKSVPCHVSGLNRMGAQREINFCYFGKKVQERRGEKR